MINRYAIKENAKNLCRSSKPSLIVMGLIFTALSIIVSSLSSKALSTNVTQDGFQRFMAAYSGGNYEKALTYADSFQPSRTGTFISALLSVVMWIVSAGFSIFVMNTVRGREASYGNILDGFGMTFRIVVLNVLESLIIGILCCLLIVPGIIFSYAYRQALYILLDNPDKSVVRCLRDSRMMMKGHKMELFRMDLSFLGWFILSAIIAPAEVWVAPYTKTSYVMYYEALRGGTSFSDFSSGQWF